MQAAVPSLSPLMRFYVALAKSQNISCPITDWQTSNVEIEKWLSQVETAVSPAALRQFMQAETSLCNEITLGALIRHYARAQWSDKLYVALAEYLVNCTPKWFQDTERVSLADVADVLEPVLGPAQELPKWVPELEALITELSAYEHLHELAEHGIFERGRMLKAKVAKDGLDTMGLVAFVRFNYLLRQTFTTLWEADLWWIQQTLDELESRAEFFVDCSEIGLSIIEPTNELNAMVHAWKRPSFTEYAKDETYQRVQKLRMILDSALHQLEPA
ncbi:MAG TPA: hypothetical protein VG897_17765 [Terriglobales bacterium]|nr:hypothetical protein [Terriglobales bacterium]